MRSAWTTMLIIERELLVCWSTRGICPPFKVARKGDTVRLRCSKHHSHLKRRSDLYSLPWSLNGLRAYALSR